MLFLFDFCTKLLPFIKWHKWYTLLRVIPSVILAAFFQLRLLRNSHKFVAIQIFIWLYKSFIKNSVSECKLQNLEMFYKEIYEQTGARKSIFQASGGTNFENFATWSNHGDIFMGSMYAPVCPKKFWIHHWAKKINWNFIQKQLGIFNFRQMLADFLDFLTTFLKLLTLSWHSRQNFQCLQQL